MLGFLVFGALAWAVLLMGRWGKANAESLVVPTMPEADRAHRVAVLRRGAGACFPVALVLAAVSVLSLF